MRNEKSFVIIKPDGIQRSLVGTIVERFERVGLKIVALKMIIPTKDQVRKHYTVDPEWIRKVGEKSIIGYEKKGMVPPTNNPIEIGEKVLENLTKYLSSGPVLAMVLQGVHAVGIVRKIVGGTEPLTSDVGTIRGDYVLDSYQISDTDGRPIRNLIHASGNVGEANAEIGLWFKEDEILKYRHIQDAILYDVNLDGILETDDQE
ncbi:MAG: nucleoside-diphosphate kinase [Candidatus Paceibacterota bacterium]|jgi:nucleoside-diphosphate kinase